MERRRAKLNTCGITILAGILTLAPTLYGQKDTGPAEASQQDAANLQRAREFLKASRLDDAERICMSLLGRGGTIAADAQTLLDQVKSRRVCLQDLRVAVPLMSRKDECMQAMEILQGIQKKCPDFPGLDGLLRAEKAQCPALQHLPGLDEGIALYDEGDYRGALATFESSQSRDPNSADLQGWIKKTKEKLSGQTEAEQLERKIEASLRHNDAAHAKEQLARLKELAPQDRRIPMLQEKLQRLPGGEQADQEQDRSSAQGELLQKAIRAFYTGDLPGADKLLEQYLGQPNNHEALAYFYRGAIACTDYFLTGAKDQEKQTLALEFFFKARQADRQFTPPSDWISPKITAMYEKTAAGS